MLTDENRMTAKGRLFAVIRDDSWRQAFGNEVFSVAEYQGQAFAAEIITILAAQVKTAAEGRLCECGKKAI